MHSEMHPVWQNQIQFFRRNYTYMYGPLWLIIRQCLQTSNEASTMLAFKVYFQCESAYFCEKNLEIFIWK